MNNDTYRRSYPTRESFDDWSAPVGSFDESFEPFEPSFESKRTQRNARRMAHFDSTPRYRRSALRLLLTFALVALAITISVFLGAGLLRVSLAAPATSTAPAASPLAVGSGLGERSTSAGNTNADNVSDPNSAGVLLVNASHPLPQGYGPVETVKLEGIVPVLDDTVSTASELAEPLRRLFAAAGAAGHLDLYVTNGYRTYDEQRQLYDDAPDKSYVLPPGHSEHEAGLAVDIFVAGVSEDMVATAASNEWLRTNSWRYGFILRYPADKVRFTEIAYEPWHFRYVGEDIARVCYEQELCLEEYVEQYAA